MRAEVRDRGATVGVKSAGPRWSAWARALLVLALSFGATSCKPLDDVMVWAFGRSMRDSRSFDPYESPRPPAEGSMPFAAGNYPAQMGEVNVGQPELVPYDIPSFTAADMQQGLVASAMVNPVAPTEESLARGQLMYERYCAVCHGAEGLSAGAPIMPAFPLMAAFNLASGRALGFSDGYIYGMIRVGRGLMPAYGYRVTHFDRWHIVNYVRQLQGPAAAAPGAAGG